MRAIILKKPGTGWCLISQGLNIKYKINYAKLGKKGICIAALNIFFQSQGELKWEIMHACTLLYGGVEQMEQRRTYSLLISLCSAIASYLVPGRP